MPAYKDKARNTWYTKFYITGIDGKKHQKLKRGFATKHDALAYERTFQAAQGPDMTFQQLYTLYMEDSCKRLKDSTLQSKRHIFKNHILPYFSHRHLHDITPADIRNWQNSYLGKDYSNTYLKSLNNQLISIMRYAERFYCLSPNPCTIAGNMGSSQAREMDYWTREEFRQFISALENRPKACLAFNILYWTGVREGELLALTYEDILFTTKEISITKTYYRYKGEDIVTTPKTPKSIRKVPIPDFLCENIQSYMELTKPKKKSDRIFPHTKSFLIYELKYGCKASGVKQIRIHDIRHSHVSLLINLGFTPVVIAQRVGHNNVSTTLNTYSHMFPHQQQALVEALEQLK